MNKPMSVLVFLKDKLTLPGETFKDFRDQWLRLTDEDRNWFKARARVEYPEIVFTGDSIGPQSISIS